MGIMVKKCCCFIKPVLIICRDATEYVQFFAEAGYILFLHDQNHFFFDVSLFKSKFLNQRNVFLIPNGYGVAGTVPNVNL